MALLDVKDLSVTFVGRKGKEVLAVDNLSFTVDEGESVGLVGESGCGKSVTSLSILGLLPSRGVRVRGSILFDGRDLLAMGRRELGDVRGRDIGMVFQDPMSSLNPVVTIGVQLVEVLKRHRKMRRGEAKVEAESILRRVGISDPARRLGEYPHQLSGGMRQRVLVGIAIACRPRLLIADEPTTALDVTTQAQILDLLRQTVDELGSALVMVTHDLGVVAGMCDRVNVLYCGRLVESASKYDHFSRPRHRYTVGLMKAAPRIDDSPKMRLMPVPGSVLDAIPWSAGCAFYPRCDTGTDACLGSSPPMVLMDNGHQHRCVHPADIHSGLSQREVGSR